MNHSAPRDFSLLEIACHVSSRQDIHQRHRLDFAVMIVTSLSGMVILSFQVIDLAKEFISTQQRRHYIGSIWYLRIAVKAIILE